MLWLAGPALALLAGATTADSGYWAIVERYRAGEHADAVSDLGRLPPPTVARVVRQVLELAEKASGCDSCPARTRLAELPLLAAAMLHTDRAWSRRGANTAQLRVAESLLQAARLFPGEADAFARRWRLAVTLEAFARTDGTLALSLGREGLEEFPGDPDLLLALGTLLESLAAPSPGGPAALEGADLHRGRLGDAARLFDAAAAAAPDPSEALVRLGRVEALLGHHRAATTLDRAATSAKRSDVGYLAHLYLGALHESAGRFDDAAREYRRAVSIVPSSQASRVALSHALRARGDVRAAREALRAALSAPARSPDADPYWSYPWGHSGEAERMLAGLREAAR